MTNHIEYYTFEAAAEAIEATFAAYPESEPDEIGYDVVESVAVFCEPAVAAEIRRCFL